MLPEARNITLKYYHETMLAGQTWVPAGNMAHDQFGSISFGCQQTIEHTVAPLCNNNNIYDKSVLSHPSPSC